MKEHFNIIDRLHTDVLEDKYGKINSKIIIHNSKIREANLVDKKGISRTFAITFFPKKWKSNEINNINEEIKSGIPIGKAFRNNKYAIRKNVIDVFTVKIPEWLMKEFKTKSHYAKARLSEFYARKKNKQPIIYGTVVEIYSPDFREPMINSTDIAQINASTECFKKAGIGMVEIWDRLGQDNYWADKQNIYNKAKNNSLGYVYDLKKKIREYLLK